MEEGGIGCLLLVGELSGHSRQATNNKQQTLKPPYCRLTLLSWRTACIGRMVWRCRRFRMRSVSGR